MPSLFASLAAAASATVDAVYAEGFRLHTREAPEIAAPMLANGRRDVNARKVASAVRSSFEFQAVFIAAGSTVHAKGRGMSASTTRPMITERPCIDLDIAVARGRFQRDDIVERDDTGERFSVADPFEAIDLGRARVWLVEVKA